jgi:phenylalanine ammonia-lyase
MKATLERTSTMDAADQMLEVASSSSTMLLNFIASPEYASSQGSTLAAIPGFQAKVALQGATLLNKLRREFLSGQRGASPASPYLGKTRSVYEFIRVKLGIRMHGAENYNSFVNGLGVDDVTVGQNASVIYEVRGFPAFVGVTLNALFSGYSRWANAKYYCSPFRLSRRA